MEKQSVDINNLPAQFGEFLAQTKPGDEILITEGGHPRAMLTPIVASVPQPDREVVVTFLGVPKTVSIPNSASAGRRIAGLGRGKIRIMPDFDTPLPDKLWLGES